MLNGRISSLIIGIVFLLVAAANSFAADTIKITAEEQRLAIATALTKAYCPDATVQGTVRDGDKVVVDGPGGVQMINISDGLLVKLQKYNADGLAGQQLSDICPTQARQFQSAWGDASKNRVQRADVSGVFAPDSMRLIEAGDKCDERAFQGEVVGVALEVSGGKSTSVIELHERKGKSKPYKGKRLYVNAETQTAVPFVWASSGKCVREYDTKPLSQTKLQGMMLTSESVTPADFSDLGQEEYGAYMTSGVIVLQ